MINICIVDDHPTILEGIKNMLNNSSVITVVATFESATAFMEAYAKKAYPDVIVLDLQMPDKTGDKLIQHILKKDESAKVLAFSNFDSPFYVESMMQNGAKGYLLKSSTKADIIEAIEKVYHGENYITPQLEEDLQRFSKYKTRLSKTQLTLTEREKQILQEVANGLTTKAIAEKLHLSYHTVENYRNNIMMKLGVNNSAELIKKAIMMNVVK